MYSLLILFLLISIVTSFLCSMWEAVLLSVTPSYAELSLREGTPTGIRLQELKKDVDKPLSAILTLNTIAHTVGAIGVGVQAGEIWGESSPLMTSLGVPVFMTLAILILSEILPKTFGANNWKSLVPFTVKSLSILIYVLYPLVVFCELITRSLKKGGDKSLFSRSEFLAMTEIGASQGVIEPRESKIIANLLQFESVLAKKIMTPRTVVKAVSRDLTVEEFYKNYSDIHFSRIPIYVDNSIDKIEGYVLKSEILKCVADNQPSKKLHEIKREILSVLEESTMPDLFNLMVSRREHISLVKDEYGGTSGIVTMEDVIETLLGIEVVDELDKVEDMQEFARKSHEATTSPKGS